MASTYLDDIFGPLASDLIGDLGKSITYTVVNASGYDPSTGQANANSASSTKTGIVGEFSGRELAAGLVQVGDKKVSIAGEAFSVPPKPTDKVTVDGAVFTVMAAKAIYSGEKVALYELTCRRP